MLEIPNTNEETAWTLHYSVQLKLKLTISVLSGRKSLLHGTILWAKQWLSWHLAVLTCQRSSQMGLVTILLIIEDGEGQWAPSSSIPPVVCNSTLTAVGFRKEYIGDYKNWGRWVYVVHIYVAMGKSPFLLDIDFPEWHFCRRNTHTPVSNPLSMLPK